MAVTNVTSFGRSGLADWLVQRISGVIITIYLVFIVAYLIAHPGLTHGEWVELHRCFWVRLLSVMTILSFAAHAWIGMWAVLTDYVTVRLLGPKATALRIFLQFGVIAVIITYVGWAVDILWGI